MGKKNLTYLHAQKYVKDKDLSVNTFIDNSLNKTQQIFTYNNLPDTIPQSELEYILQTKGHCLITKVNDVLYALRGAFSGVGDVYENPKQYTVSNVALNLNKTYDINDNCILMKNDYKCVGLLPTLQKYAVLLTDSDISLNVATVLSRITMLISASDDKTKASADIFIQKILDGDFSIIGENGFMDGVKMQSTGVSNTSYITQLIELVQYYKATFLNEIGLNANFNMKRERLNESEVLMNIDNLLPLIENMYSERKKAIDKINEMFELNITVDYNGVWKTTHEHADKEEVAAETTTSDDIETEETEEPIETEETVETSETEETVETSETEETVETTETEETVETTETEETEETEEKEEKENKKKGD